MTLAQGLSYSYDQVANLKTTHLKGFDFDEELFTAFYQKGSAYPTASLLAKWGEGIFCEHEEVDDKVQCHSRERFNEVVWKQFGTEVTPRVVPMLNDEQGLGAVPTFTQEEDWKTVTAARDAFELLLFYVQRCFRDDTQYKSEWSCLAIEDSYDGTSFRNSYRQL